MGDPINDKLIELIRDRPCLYDLNHSDNNSYQVKEKQWSEIAKKLKIDVTFLKKRWKVIRDRYRKEWNTFNNAPHSKGKSSWRHYKQISYLEPHIKPRPRTIAPVPKSERIESQPKFTCNDEYDDLSEYIEMLESDVEGEPNEMYEPQTVLEHTRLIETVKSMPNLYDPLNYNYNSRHLKQTAWKQLAKEFDTTVDSVKLKWQELRDRFRREYIKVRDHGGAFISSFEYYEQLSFLIDSLNRSASRDLEAEIVYCNDLSKDNEGEDDKSYQYLKEEEEEVSSETNNWFKLDDRDCKVVQFIRNNPVLYDIHHPKYRDIPMRNRKWAQLSFELDQDISSLKVRWQTIQERYRLYNPSDQDDSNSRKFIEMLEFLDQTPNAYDSDSASNMKYEIESNDSAEEYAVVKTPINSSDKTAPRTRISSDSSSYQIPTTTNPAPHDSSNNSHVKMFFDSVAAQIEAENLPFRHFSIIQQEVLKVVHGQISSYIKNQQ